MNNATTETKTKTRGAATRTMDNSFSSSSFSKSLRTDPSNETQQQQQQTLKKKLKKNHSPQTSRGPHNRISFLRQRYRHHHATISHSLKADMCRLAALYLRGGYSFAIDLQTLEPIQLQTFGPRVKFISTTSASPPPPRRNEASKDSVAEHQQQQQLPSFIASSQGHPILRQALTELAKLLAAADSVSSSPTMPSPEAEVSRKFGTAQPKVAINLNVNVANTKVKDSSYAARALQTAHQAVSAAQCKPDSGRNGGGGDGTVEWLYETKLTSEFEFPLLEPQVPIYQDDENTLGCNRVVHDRYKSRAFFFAQVKSATSNNLNGQMGCW